MLEHLNFFLTNPIFEVIIGMIFLINSFHTMILDVDEVHKKIKIERRDNFIAFRMIVFLIVSLVMGALLVLKFHNVIIVFVFFIFPAFSLVKSLLDIYKNHCIDDLKQKYYIVYSSITFIIFCSSKIVPLYIQVFQELPHYLKEILLIIFLTIKIILFVFLLSSNILILTSIIKPPEKEKDVNDTYKIIDYPFPLFKKKQTQLYKIIDGIIYIILSPITIILNYILFFLFKFINKIKNTFYKTLAYLNDNKNFNVIIKKLTNISIILSFIVVNIILIIFDNQFNKNVISIYKFISTIILLPIIYDSITKK